MTQQSNNLRAWGLDRWKVGVVSVAWRKGGAKDFLGLVSARGVALDERIDEDSGHRCWHLTHQPTGLRIVGLSGLFHEVIAAAEDIANCWDWTTVAFPPSDDARTALIPILEHHRAVIEVNLAPQGTANEVERFRAHQPEGTQP